MNAHLNFIMEHSYIKNKRIKMKELVLFGAYTNTPEKEITLVKNILEWKKHNITIALSTHYPINERIQNLVDYYIFDKEQHMNSKLTVFQYFNCNEFEILARANRPYHAAAGLIALQNAIRMIGDKFDIVYLLDYDVQLKVPEVLKFIRSHETSPFELFMFNWKGNPDAYATNGWFFKRGGYNKIWGDIQSVQDYLDLIEKTKEKMMFTEHLAKNLIELNGFQNLLYLFDKEEELLLMGNFSEHTADVEEPRIYLASTVNDAAILFLVNQSKEIFTFEIKKMNLITGEKEEYLQDLHGGLSMIWKLLPNNTFLSVSCGNIKKEYYITPVNTFNECRFTFRNNTQLFCKNQNV